MSGLQDDALNVSQHFSRVLLHNPLSVQHAMRQCRSADGTYNMLNVVNSLVKLPTIRDSLEKITCCVQYPVDDAFAVVSLVEKEPYGSKLVQFMLNKEKYFSSFRCSYYLLYQTFSPTTSPVILRRYAIPVNFKVHLLKKINWRIANQSMLNYLLIELRRDKDAEKFWCTLQMMIDKPELQNLVVKKYQSQPVVSTQPMIISVTGDEKVDFECCSDAALPAIPMDNATENLHGIMVQLNVPLTRRRCHYKSTRDGTGLINSDSVIFYHLFELLKNDKGYSPDEQKLKVHAEIDRLVDHGHLSYGDMAAVCLTIDRMKREIMDEVVGFVGGSHNRVCQNDFSFLTSVELAALNPNIFAVFEKYDSLLLDNFPENYMTTMEIIHECYPTAIPGHIVMFITAPSCFKGVNQRILQLIINSMIKANDSDAKLWFLYILRDITGGFSQNAVLRRFEKDMMYAVAQDTIDTQPVTTNSGRVKGTEDDLYLEGPKQPHHWVGSSLYQSAPNSSLLPDSAPDILSMPNSLNKLKPKTQAVIRKHYKQLVGSFPKDHMVSLERYISICKPSDGTIDMITSADTSYQANQRLFACMTWVILPSYEDTFFCFCNDLEVVIGDPGKIEQLRNDLVEAVIEDASNTATDDLSHNSQVQPLSGQHSMMSQPSLSPQHSLTQWQSISSQQSIMPTEGIAARMDVQEFNGLLPTNNEEVSSGDIVLNTQYLNTDGAQQNKAELAAVMQKHYIAILNSFHKDYNVTKERLDLLGHQLHPPANTHYTHSNSRNSTEMLLYVLINSMLLSDEKDGPIHFCATLTMLIGDLHTVRDLQKDLFKILKTEAEAASTLQFALSCNKLLPATSCFKDREESLSSFDDCYDLLLKVNPRFVKRKFLQFFKFEHGDPLTGNLLFQPNEVQMEVLLVHVRSSIGTYGATCFLQLVDILCRQEPYKEIGFYLLDTYHAKGSCKTTHGLYNRTGNLLPMEELVKKMQYHSKQLLAGLQYQPPIPLPCYYIPRPNLLNRLTKAVMGSETSFGVDVVIHSILPGFGKSTLVKAFCCHCDALNYFLDGFLWINVGLSPVNHNKKLMDIYHQLTAMTFTGDYSVLVKKLKQLVTDHLQRLLVIITNVYAPDDMMPYLEIFQCCKVIMLSTKDDLTSTIPIRHKIQIEVNDFDAQSVTLMTPQVDNLNKEINKELFVQLKGLADDLLNWPIMLSLVRHLLLLYCNKYQLSIANALQRVIQSLLIAKRNDHFSYSSTIIESMLQFLGNEDIARLNKLASFVGLEHFVLNSLLPYIWEVSEDVADECTQLLHSCGLIQYSERLLLTETMYSVVQCVEMHWIVYHYFLTRSKPVATNV